MRKIDGHSHSGLGTSMPYLYVAALLSVVCVLVFVCVVVAIGELSVGRVGVGRGVGERMGLRSYGAVLGWVGFWVCAVCGWLVVGGWGGLEDWGIGGLGNRGLKD